MKKDKYQGKADWLKPEIFSNQFYFTKVSHLKERSCCADHSLEGHQKEERVATAESRDRRKKKAFHRHFAKSTSTFVMVDVRMLYSYLDTAVAFGLIQDPQGTAANTSNNLYV